MLPKRPTTAESRSAVVGFNASENDFPNFPRCTYVFSQSDVNPLSQMPSGQSGYNYAAVFRCRTLPGVEIGRGIAIIDAVVGRLFVQLIARDWAGFSNYDIRTTLAPLESAMMQRAATLQGS